MSNRGIAQGLVTLTLLLVVCVDAWAGIWMAIGALGATLAHEIAAERVAR